VAMSPKQFLLDATGQAGDVKNGNGKTVLVAMSGGVDSSAAALLLKQQGYDVTGVFLNLGQANYKKALDAAKKVAKKIGIPLKIINLRKEFKKEVIDYFLKTYQAGDTPNPCVVCNQKIKFGLFFKAAIKMGANFIATGHYIQMKEIKNPVKNGAIDESRNDPKCSELVPINRLAGISNSSNMSVDNFKGRGPAGNQTPETRVPTPSSNHPGPTAYSLYKARDKNKDQSYFLYNLTQKQLAKLLFPLGDFTKKQVIRMAERQNLPYLKKESQDICFLPFGAREFLRKNLELKKGEVVTTDGKIIGSHNGLPLYTVGQRASIGGVGPYYVFSKNPKKNQLIVVRKNNKKSFHKEIKLKNVNWIGGTAPQLRKILVRTRYRQPLVSAKIMLHVSRYMLHFDQPVKFIAPGQSAVFYSKDGELLGGGVII